MLSNDRKLIAVIGATGQEGGALQTGGEFKVRALSRNPGKHRELAEDVVEADLDRPETLKAAFEGAHGVFLVTNFWEEGTDELKQATALGDGVLRSRAEQIVAAIGDPARAEHLSLDLVLGKHQRRQNKTGA